MRYNYIYKETDEKTYIKQTNPFKRWGYDNDKTFKPFIIM